MSIFTAHSSDVGGAVYRKVVLKYSNQHTVCSMSRVNKAVPFCSYTLFSKPDVSLHDFLTFEFGAASLTHC